MSARYLLRFDDICPTMEWDMWDKIEAILLRHHIKPILSVVPDNLDYKLMVNKPKADFWERVRVWQALGWTIALHGYQHLYETDDPGLIGINAYSEFAGLSYDVQRSKLERAVAMFADHGVHVDVWVAPAHAFDEVTIKALLDLGIKMISDGFYWRPVNRLGALWIPQQIWKFRAMPFGVWTVCYHHNFFVETTVRNFELDIQRFVSSIASLESILREYPIKDCGVIDTMLSVLWLKIIQTKRRLGSL